MRISKIQRKFNVFFSKMSKSSRAQDSRIELKADAPDEQFEIVKSYLNSRHLNGGMSNMDAVEFSSMIEESNVQSKVFEYRTKDCKGEEQLLAVCLTDTNRDGLSMVYSFYRQASIR